MKIFNQSNIVGINTTMDGNIYTFDINMGNMVYDRDKIPEIKNIADGDIIEIEGTKFVVMTKPKILEEVEPEYMKTVKPEYAIPNPYGIPFHYEPYQLDWHYVGDKYHNVRIIFPATIRLSE